MNKIPLKYLDWLDRHQTFEPKHLGTRLFVTASAFMIDGVATGGIHLRDMMCWVQGARQNNVYGEAEETREAMRQFVNIVLEDIK